MFDLHRHDEFSFYDGSGKARELAQIAQEKGYTALGLTNHGNTNGLVQHYDACKQFGIKPVMGVEGYFIPKYKPQHRGYHLILIAKNMEGFKNINIIQTKGEMQKFYNPIWDFEILQKYSEGVICTSACVASYSSQCIAKGEIDKAEKYLNKMKEIFADDFYVEIQPYVVSEKGLQEKVNIALIKLAKKLKIKMILTSDSHRGKKEDIEAYIKMHELKNANSEYLEHVRLTYSERYMPEKDEMQKRFIKMHSCDFGVTEIKKLVREMEEAIDEIEEKVDSDILDKIASMPALPKYDENQNSFKLLKSKVKQGLIDKKLYNKKYIERAKEELDAIKENKYEDYFLIVQDYTLWAKNNGIAVGPGRGSGCNCLVNYALGITDVDPIYFDLDYRRFIRKDKKKLPDIDIDFEPNRRAEVQAYLIKKHWGNACQIASYGLYRIDNLVNDLVKTYNNIDDATIKKIKNIIYKYQGDVSLSIDLKELVKDEEAKKINKIYPNIIDAFCFLYNKVKYMGTHAAGVAYTKQSIYYYTALRYDKKNDKYFSCYNLVDLERLGVIKYDILGLGTLTSLFEIRRKYGFDTFDYRTAIEDKEVMKAFSQGKTNGVFQYTEPAAQKLLEQVQADCFNDVVAVSAMNRPGPISNGVPSMYAESKVMWTTQKDKPVYSEIIDSTYGCILYQEQVAAIAVGYGGLNWDQTDKVRKMDKNAAGCKELIDKYKDEFCAIFEKNMKKYGLSKTEADELFEKFTLYTFNKGHAVGYALISLEEMYYKVHFPADFWYTKMKQIDLDKNGEKYMTEAILDGLVIFLPHVNYSADFSLRKVDGEQCMQMGLSSIKGIGSKAAKYIEDEKKKNGIFKNYDDFYDRCKSRVVTSRVINILKEQGALEFKRKVYLSRVKKYNIALYSRAKT